MSAGHPVPRRAPEPERVARMFDDVARRYDLVNTLLSLGQDAWWRRRTARMVPVPSTGARILDLGCGTGKLGALFAGRARPVGIDVSVRMLQGARARYGSRLSLVLGSAFALPFGDASVDGVVSAFVLRNLNDLPGVFGELHRVTKPGGTVALVDITGPRSRMFRRLFDAYFGTVAPALGALVGEREAYRYLSRSLAQLPSPQVLAGLLGEAGFERVRIVPMSGGMVTLWVGRRP